MNDRQGLRAAGWVLQPRCSENVLYNMCIAYFILKWTLIRVHDYPSLFPVAGQYVLI